MIKKEYDINKIIEALSTIIVDSIVNEWDADQNFVINKIKYSLESIIFGDKLDENKELKDYLCEAKQKNHKYGLLLEQSIDNALNNN